MKVISKIVEGENAPENQNDSAKKNVKPRTKKQSGTLNEGIAESTEIKPDSDEATKPDAKVPVVKSSKKEKHETEPMVQNVVIVDLKEEPENPEPDKKQKEKIKVVKNNAKKAEEKVDKLKKKVKKAKKKEVKKSKLNGLKDQLEKALEKFKISVKKLKKAKK